MAMRPERTCKARSIPALAIGIPVEKSSEMKLPETPSRAYNETMLHSIPLAPLTKSSITDQVPEHKGALQFIMLVKTPSVAISLALRLIKTLLLTGTHPMEFSFLIPRAIQ